MEKDVKIGIKLKIALKLVSLDKKLYLKRADPIHTILLDPNPRCSLLLT